MKTIIQSSIVLACVLLFCDCNKPGSPAPAAGTAACQLQTESTTLSGNAATYEYTYGTNGRVSLIKKFIGGQYHVLQDSAVVGDYTVAHYGKSTIGLPLVITTVYNKSMFDDFPTECKIAIQEGAVTKVNQFHYFFFYDTKNRLSKIGEQTDLVVGDYEYDLSIIYNDHDNVTGLKYELTTGPNTITTIPASGYDDKPNPFAGVQKWYFFMHAAWNNYDPEPVFTALSKNNPLGYVDGAYTRTMTYSYNDKGFPTVRNNTNTIAGSSASFTESFNYLCK